MILGFTNLNQAQFAGNNRSNSCLVSDIDSASRQTPVLNSASPGIPMKGRDARKVRMIFTRSLGYTVISFGCPKCCK